MNQMVSKSAISHQMKKVKSADTRPEIAFRKALWASGVRYRKNYKELPGSPDVAILKTKTAVFIDGEFWHGLDKKAELRIHRHKDYWFTKIHNNVNRDKAVNQQLAAMGWTVIRFPSQYALHHPEDCVTEVIQAIAFERSSKN